MDYSLKNFSLGVCLALGLASCTSETDFAGAGHNNVAFTASVTGTRAAGGTWSAGDRIGIYMKPAGSPLADATDDNVSYTTGDASGYFTGTTRNLAYPADGTAVDFVAYYPYKEGLAGTTYTVNVADQSSPESIDLMYADNLKGLDRTSGTAALGFSHQLACLTLTLNAADGQSLDGMTATVNGVPTTADFSLADATFSASPATGDVKMRTEGSGTSLTATAFLIPTAAATTGTKHPLAVTITSSDGKAQRVTLSDDLPLEKGKSYSYTLNVKNTGSGTATTPSYVHWTETPTITAEQLASAHLQYVTHYFTDNARQVRNYSLLYDTDLKLAYWVAYPLCNYYTKKNVERTDDWAFDPSVDESLQADMHKGLSGYDRGHQIPSADRLVTREANQQTFYYTNMTAQLGALNQQAWASLETKVRSWSSNIDTLYVVTGAMPSAQGSTGVKYTTDNSGNRIAVPAYYFKALARIDRQTGQAYTIAFKFDNARFSGNYMDAALSVKDLEEMTGFTFFPTIAGQYKESYDAAKWQ